MGAAAKINRRGACPALAAPMQTGDGLLARLNPVSQGLTPAQLIGLSASATRHGNGIVEVTSRGSLQLRGLSQASARALAGDINDLGIDVLTGPSVVAGPLAGIDAAELADPRPLRDMIRAEIARRRLGGRLAPKVSVVVDGSGAWNLDMMEADIRLKAEGNMWRVTAAAEGNSQRLVGTFHAEEAVATALAMLEELALLGSVARARDLRIVGEMIPRDTDGQAPLGAIALHERRMAVAFALPFGTAMADQLEDFARQAHHFGVTEFRPAPPRTLIAILCPNTCAELLAFAEQTGFVIDPESPLLRIHACPGAPACASATFDTRAAARQIVEAVPALFEDRSFSLHVSGCPKGCAHPATATVTLVGNENGIGVIDGGTARSTPALHCRLDEKELSALFGRKHDDRL
ncbi:MAG: precorrin-3B synthase [Rhizobiaceae bacterium]|nr:precorrin-3B synthase [Rhizobiaceae bacterium]